MTTVLIPVGPLGMRLGTIEKKGEVVPGHRHNFDHPTFVFRGALRIHLLVECAEADATTHEEDENGKLVPLRVERSVDVRAGGNRPWALILAGRWHALEALEDDTAYGCAYLHRDALTGEVIDKWDGWAPAYE